MPTTSAVRKVRLGSSNDRPRECINFIYIQLQFFHCVFFIIAIIPNTPIRLAINAGVSLQRTVVLPDVKLPYSIKSLYLFYQCVE